MHEERRKGMRAAPKDRPENMPGTMPGIAAPSAPADAPVVCSLLENDLYKFTMWQALLHSNPGAQAEYRFVCRNTPAFPLADLKEAFERELTHLCSMHFTQEDLDYLSGLRFIKSDFVDFLSVFRF